MSVDINAVFSNCRNVNLEEENEPYRKGSCGTVRSEGTGAQYYAKVSAMGHHGDRAQSA